MTATLTPETKKYLLSQPADCEFTEEVIKTIEADTDIYEVCAKGDDYEVADISQGEPMTLAEVYEMLVYLLRDYGTAHAFEAPLYCGPTRGRYLKEIRIFTSYIDEEEDRDGNHVKRFDTFFLTIPEPDDDE